MRPSNPKTIEELLEGHQVLHDPACECGQDFDQEELDPLAGGNEDRVE